MAQTADKLDVAAARQRFSSLQQGFTFFDAPGGSQVPDEVGDAIARTLREASANSAPGTRPAAASDGSSSRPRPARPGSSAASRTR